MQRGQEPRPFVASLLAGLTRAAGTGLSDHCAETLLRAGSGRRRRCVVTWMHSGNRDHPQCGCTTELTEHAFALRRWCLAEAVVYFVRFSVMERHSLSQAVVSHAHSSQQGWTTKHQGRRYPDALFNDGRRSSMQVHWPK